jgi:hypothetical protein
MVKTLHRRKSKEVRQAATLLRKAPKSRFLIVAAAVYAVAVLYSLWHGVVSPVRNWDMMGYIGCIISLDTSDPVEIHTRMLAEIKPVVWPQLYIEYAEKNQLSNNAENFYRQLPYYRIKPLYVGAVWLFHKLGAGLAQATWLVSTVAFVAVAALLAWWKPEKANRGVWLLTLSALMLFGYIPLGIFAGYSVPDPLSLMFFLAAFMGWMRFGSLPLYLSGNLLCILARPDALIQVVAMAVYFSFFAAKEQRLKPALAIAAVASCLAGYAVIRYVTGAGGWTDLFYRAFVDQNFDFTTGEAHLTMAQYFHALWMGIMRKLTDPRFIIILFASIAALYAAWRDRKTIPWPWFWLMLITWAALGGRYLLFPGADHRYFYSYYLIIIMAGLELLTPLASNLLRAKNPTAAMVRKLIK